jgi:hypothetical protein
MSLSTDDQDTDDQEINFNPYIKEWLSIQSIATQSRYAKKYSVKFEEINDTETSDECEEIDVKKCKQNVKCDLYTNRKNERKCINKLISIRA